MKNRLQTLANPEEMVSRTCCFPEGFLRNLKLPGIRRGARRPAAIS